MSASDFVKKLENTGLLDERVLAKIHDHMADPKKKVRVKGIARFLVDKGHMTSKQVKKLISEYEKEQESAAEVSGQKGRDTNELIGMVAEANSAGETTLDMDQPAPKADDIEMSDPAEPREQIPEIQGIELAAPQAHDPFHDPFAADHETEEEVEEVEEEEDSPKRGFKSKLQKEDQWESKWLFIGGGTLGILLILGALLYIVITRTSAEDLYKEALDSFERNSWSDAIAKFDKYIKNHSDHENFSKAKVYRANARWRIPYQSKRWEDTVRIIEEMLPNIETEDAFNNVQEDLAFVLTGTAEDITESALKTDDVETKKENLVLIDRVTDLLNNPGYVPSSIRNRPANSTKIIQVNDNRERINRQIQGDAEYHATLAKMKQLTDEGQTDAAFDAYYLFVEKYIEFKSRKPLQDAVRAISVAERDLVQSEPTQIETQTDEAPSEIVTSVVVAANNTTESTRNLVGQVVAYLVDGSVYGIDVSKGQVLWRRFVGLQTNIEPRWVNPAERQELIVSDLRNQEIQRIVAYSGELVWRAKIGEPFAAPRVTTSHVIVSTASGRIIKLMADDGTTGTAADGSAGNSAQLPQSVAVSAEFHDTNIFQLGRYSNLYVINAMNMECRDVIYVGHERDSVRVAPLYINGFLLIAQNRGATCDINVYKVLEKGKKIEKAQKTQIQMEGQVSTPLLKYGSNTVIVTSDAGHIRMLDVNPTDDIVPVRSVAEARFSAHSNGSAEQSRMYVSAESSILWVANKGISKFKIRKAQNQLEQEDVRWSSSTFLGHSVLVNDEALLICRRRQNNPMATVSALDLETMKEQWRLDFAAPFAGDPIVENDRLVAVTSQGDSFIVDDTAIANKTTGKADTLISKDVQSYVFSDRVIIEPGSYAFTGPFERPHILSINRESRHVTQVSTLKSPADKRSCEAIKFGKHVLMASSTGHIMKIDPRSGSPVGAAAQPKLKFGANVKWRRPVVVDPANEYVIADETGNVYRFRAQGDQSMRQIANTELGKQIVAPLTLFGDKIVLITRNNDGDQITVLPSKSSVEPVNTIPLRAAYDDGPYVIDGRLLIGLETGEWVCYTDVDTKPEPAPTDNADEKSKDDGDEKKDEKTSAPVKSTEKWALAIGNEQLAGSPTLVNGKLVMPMRSGKIWFVNPDNGQQESQLDIQQPLRGSAFEFKGQLVVSGNDGTIHFLKLL